MTATAISAELEALAERIARLRPVGRNGHEQFYEDRSELAHEARALAQWHRTGRRPADYLCAAERDRP